MRRGEEERRGVEEMGSEEEMKGEDHHFVKPAAMVLDEITSHPFIHPYTHTDRHTYTDTHRHTQKRDILLQSDSEPDICV